MTKPLHMTMRFPDDLTERILEELKPVYDALKKAEPDEQGIRGAVYIELDVYGRANAVFLPSQAAYKLREFMEPITGEATFIDRG